jgi:diguanylate cyclase (GGDEF)-like protein/PAS domain S-box-containing protein
MHLGDLERVRSYVMDCTARGSEEYACEYRVVGADGRVRWVHDLTWVIRNARGDITHFQGVLLDMTEQKLAAETVEKERERLWVTLEGIGDAVVAVDASGAVTLMNPVAEHLTGWSSHEATGKPLREVFEIINEITREPAPDPIARVLAEGRITGLANHTALIARDGTERSIADSAAPIRDPQGSTFGAILVFRDVTDDRRQEMALKASEERFRLLAENANDVVVLFEFQPERRWTYVSPAIQTVLGYAPEEFYQGPDIVERLLHPDDVRTLFALAGGEIDWGSPLEFRLKHKDGHMVWLEAKVSPVFGPDGRLRATQGILRDVTERKRMEQQLLHVSSHDPLTGLFNRAYFEVEMRRLASSERYPVTLVCSDIDGLKLVNDTLGHSKGDEMLRAYAGILRSVFGADTVVARIGGDEFAVLLPGAEASVADSYARSLEESLANHNRLQASLPLSASIGISTCRDAGTALEETLNRADKNMYRDKVHRTQSTAHGVVRALLTALAAKDYVVEGHIARVSRLSRLLGEAAGLSKKELSDLSLLAEVHDLGKVGIPDKILFKEGVLTEEEREEVKHHSMIGYRIARSSPELAHMADLILHHHEWWNGMGYPSGLAGSDIPIACRVLAIVDAYDAMTSDRPYSRARTQEEAIAELLRNSATQFDPSLVTMFESVLEKPACTQG